MSAFMWALPHVPSSSSRGMPLLPPSASIYRVVCSGPGRARGWGCCEDPESLFSWGCVLVRHVTWDKGIVCGRLLLSP